MKSIKSGFSLTAISLLIISATVEPSLAMMAPSDQDEKEQQHKSILPQNTNNTVEILTGMQKRSLSNSHVPPSSPILSLEEEKIQLLILKKHIKELKQKALQGDKNAQYDLGVMYQNGDFVTQDHVKAVEWLEHSANKGHLDAMNAFSRMYLEGTDIYQDCPLALKFVKKLIAYDNAEGQFIFGRCYDNGWGVNKNEKEAEKWYQKSAVQGYEPARKKLRVDISKDETKGDDKNPTIKQEEKPSPISNASGVVNRPVVSDIVIPEIAKGYEEIYRRFVMGKLIYKPDSNSDKGRIELPIRALANPLEGTFDLSQCGDSGKYLSISTGYRKGKKAENEDKVEVWLAPRFLIEKNRAGSASHFKPIMSGWSAASAPVGIFWTWGESDDLTDYHHLTEDSIDSLSDHSFIDMFWKSWDMAGRCMYAAPARRSHLPTVATAVGGDDSALRVDSTCEGFTFHL